MSVGDVAQLSTYRERRAVRRAGAYLVAVCGIAALALHVYQAREQLEWCIRKAAELLPEERAAS